MSDSSEAAKFEIDELFFSHTDQKGRILYGNEVFVRVSDFTFEEIEGKPHNVIRHKDMPKAVFKLFWSYLLAGRPVVAYVKNRSKTGKHYWVLALALPFREGFLSIRIKPSSDLFDAVRSIYAKVLETEQTKGVEAASAVLLNEIRSAGFADYDSLMVAALAKELQCRASALRLRLGSEPKTFEGLSVEIDKLCALAGTIKESAGRLSSEFKQLHFLCINLSATSESYGAHGRTTAVISETFRKWGGEINVAVDDFMHRQESFSKTLGDARYAVNAAFIEAEMSEFFQQSANRSEDYEKALQQLASENLLHALSALDELKQTFTIFASSVTKLRESLLAMRIVRLSSRVESVYLPDQGRLIESIIQDVSRFIDGLEKQILSIEADSSSAKSCMTTALETARAI